jgi:hypothetical protein
MKKLLIGLAIIIVVIVLIVIIRRSGQETAENFVIGEAQVETVEVQLQESFPVGVAVTATGILSDSCTEIGDVLQSRNLDGDFMVTLQTRRPADAQCAQVLGEFSQTFMLDGVDGLPAETYNVSVNGVNTSFELDIDNFISDFDPLK